MRFAKIVFWCAAVWGFLGLTPLYFLFATIGRQDPPAITHPDFYYGFVGVALAWQVAFVVIATDPERYRWMMLPAVLEKLSYAGALLVLYLEKRVNPQQLFFGAVDLLLGILFVIAFVRTGEASRKLEAGARSGPAVRS
jgi:hypothetical protein